MKKVIFPGAFDPITNGHLALIERAADLFTEVVVAVAQNTTGKTTFFTFEERLRMVQTATQSIPRVSAKGFQGLMVDFYRQEGAVAVIRGVRSFYDFAYEHQLAGVNQQLLPEIETLFLIPSAEASFISASMVREIARLGGNIEAFVPPVVVQAFKMA